MRNVGFLRPRDYVIDMCLVLFHVSSFPFLVCGRFKLPKMMSVLSPITSENPTNNKPQILTCRTIVPQKHENGLYVLWILR